MESRTRGAFLALSLLAAPAASQNMALALDGNDSALFVPQHVSLEPSEAYTLEAWVKGAGAVSHGRIVRKANNFGAGYMLSWAFQGNSISALVFCDFFDVARDPQPNSAYLNSWHHFAMTAEADGLISLYVDGELVATEPVPSGCLTHSGDLWFGAFNGVSEEFIGSLDEVRFWSVARTQEEIQQAMFLSKVSGPGLVSVWHLDGDGLDAVGDNHGSAFGNAQFVAADTPLSFSVEPDRGDWRGGVAVELGGGFQGLSSEFAVSFGDVQAEFARQLDPETLMVRVPAGVAPGELVPVTVSDTGFELSAPFGFVLTPRVAAEVDEASGALEVRLDVTPPSTVLVVVGQPAGSPSVVRGVDGQLELAVPRPLFEAFAPLQSSLSFTLPALPAGLSGLSLRFQALESGGASAPTWSNSVDVPVP